MKTKVTKKGKSVRTKGGEVEQLKARIVQLESQLAEANKLMLEENGAADIITKNFNKFLADSEGVYNYIHFSWANVMATAEELDMMRRWMNAYEALWIRPRERAEELQRIAKRQGGAKL